MDQLNNGYQVVQVSALGRRPVRHLLGVLVGGLTRDRSHAQQRADELNNLSTGERYEIEWFIGVPRD